MDNRLLVARQSAAAGGLLDLVPGAAAAYSLRKLSSTYTDPVVTVRRSSDDAEGSFTASEVSDGTLAAFCGVGDGFVKQWWDQSGNANHASQATPASQPKIVSGGVVVLEEGNPAIEFDGIDDGLRADALSSVASGVDKFICAFCAWSTTSGESPYGVVFGWGSTSSSLPGLWAGGGGGQLQFVRRDDAGTNATIAPLVQSTTDLLVESIVSLGDTSSLYYNGAFSGSQTQSLSATTLDAFAIGQLVRTSVGNALPGNVLELIIYPSDQTANRELIEGNIAWSYS
jgi:hypothetical protein